MEFRCARRQRGQHKAGHWGSPGRDASAVDANGPCLPLAGGTRPAELAARRLIYAACVAACRDLAMQAAEGKIHYEVRATGCRRAASLRRP
jgi:hypothetical protein